MYAAELDVFAWLSRLPSCRFLAVGLFFPTSLKQKIKRLCCKLVEAKQQNSSSQTLPGNQKTNHQHTIFSDVLYSPGIQSFPPLNRSFKFETL